MIKLGHHLTNARHALIKAQGLLMRPPQKEYAYCPDGVYLFTVATTAWGWAFPCGRWRETWRREYSTVCVVDYSGMAHEIDELIHDDEAVRVLTDIEPGRIEVMTYEHWEARFLPELERVRREGAA